MQHQPHTPPRLREVFDSYDFPVYFVTFCTANRQPVLAVTAVHEAFRQYVLRGAAEKEVAVGRYVIMPDHVHLFVCGGRDFDLGLWVRGLKRAIAASVPDAGVVTSVPDVSVGKPSGKPAGTAGATPAGTIRAETARPTLWQSGFFDHLLRSIESYGQKWQYVRANPVRASLVACAEDWPYQGEIVTLDRV